MPTRKWEYSGKFSVVHNYAKPPPPSFPCYYASLTQLSRPSSHVYILCIPSFPACLPACLSTAPTQLLPTDRPTYRPCQSVCLSVYLSRSLSLCLSVSVSLSRSLCLALSRSRSLAGCVCGASLQDISLDVLEALQLEDKVNAETFDSAGSHLAASSQAPAQPGIAPSSQKGASPQF